MELSILRMLDQSLLRVILLVVCGLYIKISTGLSLLLLLGISEF